MTYTATLPAGRLTPEQREIAELAFELGARYGDRRFDDMEAAEEQWRELRQCGLTALSVAEDHGGAGGMFDLCLAMERVCAGGFPAGRFVLTTAIAGSMINRHGTEEQRTRWLPGIADGSLTICFALTEPGAGSNSMNLRTSLRRERDAWLLTGEKTYISGADSSELMVVVAREAESGGLAVAVLPLPDARIGMTPVKVELPLPERQWTLSFDDVEVPQEALLGEPGKGHRVLFDGLNPERLLVAAQAIGVGRWCLAKAARYANERVVFDVPIGTHQAVQHPLAEALVALEGAWALTEIAARRYDEGDQAGPEANVAKVAACDAGLRAADSALQVFGGSGYTDETMVLQRFLMMRLIRSIPVSRELALNHIATALLGLPRSY
jgi:alkylation response protein AidB-like acyl-CoA dehydrogenase